MFEHDCTRYDFWGEKTVRKMWEAICFICGEIREFLFEESCAKCSKISWFSEKFNF